MFVVIDHVIIEAITPICTRDTPYLGNGIAQSLSCQVKHTVIHIFILRHSGYTRLKVFATHLRRNVRMQHCVRLSLCDHVHRHSPAMCVCGLCAYVCACGRVDHLCILAREEIYFFTSVVSALISNASQPLRYFTLGTLVSGIW